VSLARRSGAPSESATPENATFDVAAAGPDGDRRLDRWVNRRVEDRVANEPSEEPARSEPAAGEHGES